MTRPGIVVIALFAGASAGCMDAQGNRTTLWDMWKNRNAPNQEETADHPAHDPEAVAYASPPVSPADSNVSPAAEPSHRKAPEKPRPTGRPIGDVVRSEGLLVDNETITTNDILEPITAHISQLAGDAAPEIYYRRVGEFVRQQIIEAVAQHLIWKKAKEQLTDEMAPQVDKAVDRMEKDRITREFGGRETAYEKYIGRHGKTREEVRDRLRRSVIIDTYLRDRLLPLVPAPTKQELWDYYQAHLPEYSKLQRREMFLIDVPVAAFLDLNRPVGRSDEEAATEKARKTISEAQDALRAGKPFEDVARQFSHGLHKEDGGAWGFITEAPPGQSAPLVGHWDAPSRRLFELKESETSNIIEANRSFFIVKVGRIEPGRRQTFPEAQPEITNTLRQHGFQRKRIRFLQEQLENSTIGSLEDFVAEVLKAVPRQGQAESLEVLPARDAWPSRSRPLKTKDARSGMKP